MDQKQTGEPVKKARGKRVAKPASPKRATGGKTMNDSQDGEDAGPVGGKNSANLGAAKASKNDEFYTQWADIEKEMNAYLEYDPDAFRGKTILLPCDDPEWSNFAKFFALHFSDYGLKKLISTSYAPDSKPADIAYQPTLFEMEAPQYDEVRTRSNGKKFVLEAKDINGDGVINIEDLQWEYLDGDGDFRSDEVTALRDEADIVITNPPFSLFREFVAWLLEGGVKFSIIGNMNVITYKEVFPLIRDNKMWMGVTRTGVGEMWFRVYDNAPEKTGQKVEDGVRYQTVGSAAWFTNIDHGRRHQPLSLMTEADNIKYSSHKQVKGVGYRRYDNYDAIDVPFTDAIPDDYNGVMGVPVSFLGKYSPDQFEILGITKTWDDPAGLKTRTYPTQVQVSATGVRSKVGKLNDGGAIKVSSGKGVTHYEVNGSLFIQPYARLLIRRRGEDS
jgi:hypothetical protein